MIEKHAGLQRRMLAVFNVNKRIKFIDNVDYYIWMTKRTPLRYAFLYNNFCSCRDFFLTLICFQDYVLEWSWVFT